MSTKDQILAGIRDLDEECLAKVRALLMKEELRPVLEELLREFDSTPLQQQEGILLAFRAAGAIGIEVLLAGLGDERFRSTARGLLSAVAPHHPVEVLRSLPGLPKEQRAEAIGCLGGLDSEHILPVFKHLLQILRTGDPVMKLAARTALYGLRGQDNLQILAGLLLGEPEDVRAEIAEGVWLSGEDVAWFIECFLKDESSKVRQAAAQSLGLMDPPQVETLMSLVDHPDPEVSRTASNRIAGVFETHRAAVVEAFRNREPETRIKLIGASSFCLLGGMDLVLEAHADPDPRVAQAAAASLASCIPLESELPVLLARLQDDRTVVSEVALQRVKAHGGPGIEALEKARGGAENEAERAALDGALLRLKTLARSCFIATAVYGDRDAPEVRTLRRFRDRHLLPSRGGRILVSAYERCSPPLARCLDRVPLMRFLVRNLVLVPLLWLVRNW